MHFLKHHKITYWKFILSLAINIATGCIIIFLFIRTQPQAFSIVHDANNQYTFINPILDCEDLSARDTSTIIYKDADSTMNTIKARYDLTDLGVYYRDLNLGPWFGYNEKSNFIPASLVKVPMMISIYKYAEDHPGVLDSQVTIHENDLRQQFTAVTVGNKKLEVGMTYTLRDVINYMIQDSDNTGVGVLMNNFDEERYLSDIFRSVGVVVTNTPDETYLRVKDYAGFFRVLYNASYLTKDMSELALRTLSHTSFTDGIVAGVPEGTLVAHKFGERIVDPGLTIEGQSNVNQFHDCGIVYYPQHPYVMCIMTRGKEYKKQISAIRDISKYFYDQVAKKE